MLQFNLFLKELGVSAIPLQFVYCAFCYFKSSQQSKLSVVKSPALITKAKEPVWTRSTVFPSVSGWWWQRLFTVTVFNIPFCVFFLVLFCFSILCPFFSCLIKTEPVISLLITKIKISISKTWVVRLALSWSQNALSNYRFGRFSVGRSSISPWLKGFSRRVTFLLRQ